MFLNHKKIEDLLSYGKNLQIYTFENTYLWLKSFGDIEEEISLKFNEELNAKTSYSSIFQENRYPGDTVKISITNGRIVSRKPSIRHQRIFKRDKPQIKESLLSVTRDGFTFGAISQSHLKKKDD